MRYGYGAEPPAVDASYGRVSYTQFEFLYAREKGKKRGSSSLKEACTPDTPLERVGIKDILWRLCYGDHLAKSYCLRYW